MRDASLVLGPLALPLVLAGCSSSSPAAPPSSLDGSVADSSSRPEHDAASQPDADGAPPPAEGGSNADFALCTSNVTSVVPPLPPGAAIVYDSHTSPRTVDQVIVRGSVAYYGDGASYQKIDLSSGTATTLVGPPPDSTAQRPPFDVDDQYLYFSDPSFGNPSSLGVARVALTGGATPTTLVSTKTGGRVAVAGGFLYYEDYGTTLTSSISRLPVSGGPSTLLLQGVGGGLHGLAVGGGYVYFLATNGVGSYSNFYVARVPVTAQASGDAGTPADGGVVPLGAELVSFTSDTSASGPVADDTNVYWGDDDLLMAMPHAGGAAVQLGQSPAQSGLFPVDVHVQAIAPSGANVYWSGASCSGLFKSPTGSAGNATTILPHAGALSVSVGPSAVYVTLGTGQIVSGPL